MMVLLLPVFLSADDRLHKAAYRGDLSVVRSILKEGGDPDERDSFGGTALHAAMFQSDLEVVKALVQAGLDVNAQGRSNGYTPLHDAVWAGNLDAARYLVDQGARTDLRGCDGLTPYEKALKEWNTALAEFLGNR